MKKKLTLLLAICFSVMLAFGLAGCNITATDSLDTALKADYSNVTITAVADYDGTAMNVTFKMTSNIRYMKMTGYEIYYEKDGTNYFEYSKVGTEWNKTEALQAEWDSVNSQTSTAGYAAADFDKSGSVYTLKSDKLAAYGEKIKSDITKLVITVKNNKLEKYELVYAIEEGDETPVSVVMTYSDIGTTTITLPAVTTDSLEAALNADYTNATITAVADYDGTAVTMTFKMTSDKRYMKIPGTEVYYEKTNTAVYMYIKSGSVWTKTEVDDEEWESSDDTVATDGFDVADFDKSGSVYTLKANKLAAYSLEMGLEITSVKLTVKDNKLEKYEMAYSMEGITISMVMTFSNIGTTTITLPTVA